MFSVRASNSWYNEMAIKAIEEIDGNEYIGDGVSKSKYLGILAPAQLSGGTKTLIYAMNNPEIVCPLGWLGNNCAPILAEISDKYDVTFTFAGSTFIFDASQKIHCMEKDIIVQGMTEYRRYIREEKLYEELKGGLAIGNFQ